MRLQEIKPVQQHNLYESFMASDELLEEGAKELFAAGAKKFGAAAAKLKDATDAPAQKAWADVQSRLATAGKDDAIGKLKDFASKHKIAIGTLAILGAGLLFSGDASAGDMVDAAAQAADTGPDLMSKTQADIVRSSIGANVGGVEITKDMVLDTIKNGKFPGGVTMDEYMTQVYSTAPDAKSATQMVKGAWEQALMAKLRG